MCGRFALPKAMETACHQLGVEVDTLPLTGLPTTCRTTLSLGHYDPLPWKRELTELQGRLGGIVYLTFCYGLLTDCEVARRFEFISLPPFSTSISGHLER
jgi:hypothetical protein